MNLMVNEILATEIALKAKANPIQVFQPDTNPTPQECAHRLVPHLSRIQSSENGYIVVVFVSIYDVLIPTVGVSSKE